MISSLKCPIILISGAKLKHKIDSTQHQFLNIVFAPMTLGKTVKALSNITNESRNDVTAVT